MRRPRLRRGPQAASALGWPELGPPLHVSRAHALPSVLEMRPAGCHSLRQRREKIEPKTCRKKQARRPTRPPSPEPAGVWVSQRAHTSGPGSRTGTARDQLLIASPAPAHAHAHVPFGRVVVRLRLGRHGAGRRQVRLPQAQKQPGSVSGSVPHQQQWQQQQQQPDGRRRLKQPLHFPVLVLATAPRLAGWRAVGSLGDIAFRRGTVSRFSSHPRESTVLRVELRACPACLRSAAGRVTQLHCSLPVCWAASAGSMVQRSRRPSPPPAN